MSAPNADKSTPMFAPGFQGEAKVMPESKLRQAGLLLGTSPKEGPQGLSRRASYMALRGTTPYACLSAMTRGTWGMGCSEAASIPWQGSSLTPFACPKM